MSARRSVVTLVTLVVALVCAASAAADGGTLTFSSCVQSPGSVAAPCLSNTRLDHPTDVASHDPLKTIGVTSAGTNSISAFNTITPLSYYGCLGDTANNPQVTVSAGAMASPPVVVSPNVPGPGAAPPITGCAATSNAAIDDPAGFAASGVGQAYIAGAANNAIVSIINTTAVRCVAEGAVLGCAPAHGLHHPTRMVTSPDVTQLYAATADGVAWFDISPLDKTLSFAGCIDADGSDGCTPVPDIGHEDTIAITYDGTSVYAGSAAGTIVALHRATDGSLSQLGCISQDPGAPADCTAGHGLKGLAALNVTRDGTSLYAASVLSQAVATFARAADGTIEQHGCIATEAVDTCTADPDLSTVVGVASSYDGANVYASDTHADAASFTRAADGTLTPAGCLGASGGACYGGTTYTNPIGAIVVTPDGERVYAVAEDRDDITQYARGPAQLGVATVTMTPSTFTPYTDPVSSSRAHSARHAHRGTTIRFTLSRRAKLSITISSVKGKRVTAVGVLRTTGHGGLNRLAFSGRLHGRRLARGRYVATVTAVQPGATVVSRPAAFRIV